MVAVKTVESVKVEDNSSIEGFLKSFSKKSLSCSIGSDLLNVSNGDGVDQIFAKMVKSSEDHPSNLAEIFIVGIASIIKISESPDEVLDRIKLSFLLADKVLAA